MAFTFDKTDLDRDGSEHASAVPDGVDVLYHGMSGNQETMVVDRWLAAREGSDDRGLISVADDTANLGFSINRGDWVRFGLGDHARGQRVGSQSVEEDIPPAEISKDWQGANYLLDDISSFVGSAVRSC